MITGPEGCKLDIESNSYGILNYIFYFRLLIYTYISANVLISMSSESFNAMRSMEV